MKKISNLLSAGYDFQTEAAQRNITLHLRGWLKRWGVRDAWALPFIKSAPLLIVILGIMVIWAGQLHISADVKVVGSVPAGLPALTRPLFSLALWQQLLPTALAIALVGYMVAVTGMLDWPMFQKVWVFCKRDAAALILTFVGVLAVGIEGGILIGVVVALFLHTAEIISGQAALGRICRNRGKHHRASS